MVEDAMSEMGEPWSQRGVEVELALAPKFKAGVKENVPLPPVGQLVRQSVERHRVVAERAVVEAKGKIDAVVVVAV